MRGKEVEEKGGFLQFCCVRILLPLVFFSADIAATGSNPAGASGISVPVGRDSESASTLAFPSCGSQRPLIHKKKSEQYRGPRRCGWAGAVLAVPLPKVRFSAL